MKFTTKDVKKIMKLSDHQVRFSTGFISNGAIVLKKDVMDFKLNENIVKEVVPKKVEVIKDNGLGRKNLIRWAKLARKNKIRLYKSPMIYIYDEVEASVFMCENLEHIALLNKFYVDNLNIDNILYLNECNGEKYIHGPFMAMDKKIYIMGMYVPEKEVLLKRLITPVE